MRSVKSPLRDHFDLLDMVSGGPIRRLLEAERLLNRPGLIAWRNRLQAGNPGTLMALTRNAAEWERLKAALLAFIEAWLKTFEGVPPRLTKPPLTPKPLKPLQACPAIRPGAPAHF